MTQSTVNSYGQPLDTALPGWLPAQLPGHQCLSRRWCIIKPLDIDLHGTHLFEALQVNNNDASWTYLPYGGFEKYAEFSTWIEEIQALKNEKLYAICDANTDIALGIAGYLNITPEHGVIEIGHLHFSPGLKQTPIATEAMYLMMKHAFDDLGYRRYEWKCHHLNEASIKAAKRLGFTFEGIFRQHRVVKGYNRNTVWLSILDNEWPAIKHALELWLEEGNFDAAGTQKKHLQDFLTIIKHSE